METPSGSHWDLAPVGISAGAVDFDATPKVGVDLAGLSLL